MFQRVLLFNSDERASTLKKKCAEVLEEKAFDSCICANFASAVQSHIDQQSREREGKKELDKRRENSRY